MIGGQLLNIFTEFYVGDVPFIDNLNPTDPKWIGAWWMGFIIIFVLSIITGTLICVFPAKMRNMEEINPKMESKIQGISFYTRQSYLTLRERRNDIYGIQWYFFSRKLKHILISMFTFSKKKREILKNHKNRKKIT